MLEEDRKEEFSLLRQQLEYIAEQAGTAADHFDDDLKKICLCQSLVETVIAVGIGWLQTTSYFVAVYHREEFEAASEDYEDDDESEDDEEDWEEDEDDDEDDEGELAK